MNVAIQTLVNRISGIGNVQASALSLIQGLIGLIEGVSDATHTGVATLNAELAAHAGALAGAVAANTAAMPYPTAPAGSQPPGTMPPVAGAAPVSR